MMDTSSAPIAWWVSRSSVSRWQSSLPAQLYAVQAFWVPVLFHGLLTDELLSAWVRGDSLGDAIGRAQSYQGNSALYFVLLWAWRAVADSSEVALRLPSVLWLVGAAWQLATLGAEPDGGSRVTGLAAAFVDRYRVAAVPAVALLIGLGVGRIARSNGRTVTIAIDADLVELQNLDLLDDPDWEQSLSGPIEHYGLPGDVVLLPKGPSEAAQARQRQIIDHLTASDDTIVVISRVLFRGPLHHLVDFRAAMTPDGWVETAGPVVGPHQAVVFRR